MWIVFSIISWFLGLIFFTQIIYPLFSALPRARRLEREGKLIKPIPVTSFLVAPFIWSIVFAVSIWLVFNYFPEYLKLYFIILGLVLIFVVAQIPKQNRDLEADFKRSWKKYLKEE